MSSSSSSSSSSSQERLLKLCAPRSSGKPVDAHTGLLDQSVLRISNWCTIDNLTISNFMFDQYPAAKAYFEQCDFPVCCVLLDVYSFVVNGDWYSAKKRWLEFTGHDISRTSLNLLGDEAEMSIVHLGPMMASMVTGVCQNGTCSSPVKTHTSVVPMLM